MNKMYYILIIMVIFFIESVAEVDRELSEAFALPRPDMMVQRPLEPIIPGSLTILEQLDQFTNRGYSDPLTHQPIDPFETFNKMISIAGFNETLSGGKFTIFVPTNYAFKKLKNKTLEYLLQDNKSLTEVLKYHVIVGTPLQISDLKKHKAITTLQGEKLNITILNNSTYINGAEITMADIICRNGVIHTISNVLIPTTVKLRV